MGLLAKASEMLQAELARQEKAALKASRRQRLRKLVIGTTTGVLLPMVNLMSTLPQTPANLETSIQEFADGLVSKVSNEERDMLAKLLYGEAGRGADPFEVIHTVLNRMASPLFKSKMSDVITQKGQYVGYREDNPVTNHYRRMVDFAVADWEANDCQCIDGCDHFYFVTGIQGVCNKFEISEDHQGRWVPHDQKKYEKLAHYCPVARAQTLRFFAESNNFSHSKAISNSSLVGMTNF